MSYWDFRIPPAQPPKTSMQLDAEIEEALGKRRELERLGRDEYSRAHAYIGDSSDFRLGAGTARRAAVAAGVAPEDRETFVKAWLAARDRQLSERRSYAIRSGKLALLDSAPLYDGLAESHDYLGYDGGRMDRKRRG